MPIGGSAWIDIFRLKSDHSQINKADGTTVATANTDRTMKIGGASGNNVLKASDIQPQADGSFKLKFDHTHFNSTYYTFEKIFCPRKAASSSSDIEEITDQAGRKIGGASGSGTEELALIFTYGAEDDAGKIAVGIYLGFFEKTSGGRKFEAGKWVLPNLDFNTVFLNKSGGLSIPKELFDTSIVTAPVANETFPDGQSEHIVFLSPAA